MNADLLTRLVKALTPDSRFAKFLEPLPGPTVPGGSHSKHAHVRAGVTKNHGQGETKARRKMAKESRKRNRR